MLLTVERKWKKSDYTIGNLSVDGVWFCNTLEDTDRGLSQNEPLASLMEKKVYGETAIPAGRYRITLDVVSPKYAAIPWYNSLCGGRMPRLMNVPVFSGILIHPGTTAADSLGCVLVGLNTAKGKITSSRDTFKALWAKMLKASKSEEIWIEIR